MGKLLLLFIGVPLVDWYLLAVIGSHVGWLPTLALVVASGLCGSWLFRQEGARAWRGWQRALAEGRLPEDGVLGGLLLLVGAVLLITPGVLTDVAGLLLMIPPSRRVIARLLRPRIERAIAAGPGRTPGRQAASEPRASRPTRRRQYEHQPPVDVRGPVASLRDELRRARGVPTGPHIEVRTVIDAQYEVRDE